MEQTKKKMLVIIEILKETDEEHPMTANQICAELGRRNIKAERKSVSRDIKTLSESGMDIIMCTDKKKGCYLASRQFEDWEIKILIDAVWQAQFISQNTSANLAGKLLSVTGTESQKTLRQVTPIHSHVKTANKTTQIAIDVFLRAIRDKRKVSFQYASMGTDMKLYYRKDGAVYTVSPYSLVWGSEHYYLICNTNGHEGLGYYRLDRMHNLKAADESITPAALAAGPDPASAIDDFVKNSIHHYGGRKTYLTLKVSPDMMDHLVDQFGMDMIIKSCAASEDEGKYLVTAETSESDGLYYWLLQFGSNIEIISPSSVRAKYIAMLNKILEKY